MIKLDSFCVCGADPVRPNPDCERCNLIEAVKYLCQAYMGMGHMFVAGRTGHVSPDVTARMIIDMCARAKIDRKSLLNIIQREEAAKPS